ncbi:MAG: hypothetical protein OEY19_04480 [Gammaproteobacteria bacterium]|nr:hypothetical protein [Gammaproteobacteria bacterium]MDH5630019.1 hypothetical protein [Gammaproteobacteria bacterium]
MKTIVKLTFLLLCSLFNAKYLFATQPIACGKEWINLHKNNPDLIGIYVNQTPDNLDDAKLYKNAHPVSVYYLFSDDTVHVVSYTPIGQVQDGKWYSAEKMNWLKDKVSKDFKNDVFCAFWVK